MTYSKKMQMAKYAFNNILNADKKHMYGVCFEMFLYLDSNGYYDYSFFDDVDCFHFDKNEFNILWDKYYIPFGFGSKTFIPLETSQKYYIKKHFLKYGFMVSDFVWTLIGSFAFGKLQKFYGINVQNDKYDCYVKPKWKSIKFAK